MTIDMYQASIPVFIRYLDNLTDLLNKGEAHAEAQGIEPAVMLGYRLYPDMLPLTGQVQIACDMAKRCGARLSGAEAPSDADDEASFEELRARIRRTVDYLQGFGPDEIAGTDDKPVRLELPIATLDFTGMQYLLYFALPNFFFHVTTAHGILRHCGVAIGKLDYMGAA